MKAVILVGGQGTRLLPLTCNTPKAMVPVLNVPFVENVIHHLAKHGVTGIILAQGHLARPIEGYLGDGSGFGVSIEYSIEDTPLGTAGAVKNAEKYLKGPFLMLNGDIFTDLDIAAMIDFHSRSKAKATIALASVDDPTSYGLIETDDQSRVTRFLEKPGRDEITTNTINAGTYVLEPEVLAQIPPANKVSIERDVFPGLLERGEAVYGYPPSSYWLDVGTPEKYLQLHHDLLSGKCNECPLVPGEKVTIGENSSIHPTAEIKGQAVIGDNCFIGPRTKLAGAVVIGDRCTIQEGSLIEDSVIWRNVSIGARVVLRDSIVADNCSLNADSRCEGAVLGDGVSLPSGHGLKPGSVLWPGQQ
jgi:mannose-1-phosphate guanylyltransferase